MIDDMSWRVLIKPPRCQEFSKVHEGASKFEMHEGASGFKMHEGA